MKKLIPTKKIPHSYERCFNDSCPQSHECLHHQAYQLTRGQRLCGPAIYPEAWAEGTCQRFTDSQPVQLAWGFSSLYRNVPRHQRAEARHRVMQYFSSGNGPYYRHHHGEQKLTPRQQQDILQIVSAYGTTDDVFFDHYELGYDFS